MEVFDPASTWVLTELPNELPFISPCGPETEHPLNGPSVVFVVTGTYINPAATKVLSEALSRECVFTEPLPTSGLFRIVV
jgi:hypothetical protein